MKIEVPYGKGKTVVNVPDKIDIKVIYPRKVKAVDESLVLRKAINNPLNSSSFEKFISDARDILFIVNDGTRPTPTAKVVNAIYDRIKAKNIKFLIATGIHRAPTVEEFKFIFGKYYKEFKSKIYVHDAKKSKDMVYIGTSRSGTEMQINKMALKAHKIVVIGSVEPHYFAGYTGGRKAFLPGIVSFKTIEQNHKHALNPKAITLSLKDNPVNEDMIDALKALSDKEIFSIQTVLDSEHRIYAATAGHIGDSFYAAVEKAKEVFCVKIKERADIVVSAARCPMDVDLYQSQKVLENGKLALKQNGILIMVSKCRTGIGDKTFFELLSGCKTPYEVLKKVYKNYKLGYHKALKMAELVNLVEVWGVTGINKDIEKVFIKPFNSLQEAIDEAVEKKGQKAKILFFMDGSVTVPVIKKTSYPRMPRKHWIS